MPFAGEWSDDYYSELYCPAISLAGLEPHRADDLFAPNNVVEDIWNYTEKSQIVLADLTGKNPNVFYELGLAHAIAKPVILITESEEDIPFDLRAIRIIKYDRNKHDWGEILKKKITQSIKEILKNPELAIPTPFLKTSKKNKGTTVTEIDKGMLEVKRDIELLKKELNSRSPIVINRSDRISMNSARMQIIDMIRNGFSDKHIKDILLRSGVPSMWLEREIKRTRNQQS